MENYIDNKFQELQRYIDDRFDEQQEDTSRFFNNILDLIKDTIKEERQDKVQSLEQITKKIEKSAELNKKISEESVSDLKEIKDYNSDILNNNVNKVVYKNLKQGILQFSIQMLVSFGGILIILGGFYLIRLFI